VESPVRFLDDSFGDATVALTGTSIAFSRHFQRLRRLASVSPRKKKILESSLPQETLDFIAEFIYRLETLDVLLLLQGTPSRKWTPRQVSDELRSSPSGVQKTLQHLHDRGLLAKDGDSFWFAPRSPELEQRALNLAACAREKRTAVITAIFSGPNVAVRSFAEAFRFKKGGSDG
jgi:hypothetical protein